MLFDITLKIFSVLTEVLLSDTVNSSFKGQNIDRGKMKVKHTLLNNLQTQEYFQNKYVIYAYFLFPPLRSVRLNDSLIKAGENTCLFLFFLNSLKFYSKPKIKNSNKSFSLATGVDLYLATRGQPAVKPMIVLAKT